MLQKEVADRLVAKPGTEQYGYLTLYREMFATASILMKLGPRSFYPAPKVDSAVVVLDPRPPLYRSDRDTLLDLISVSFRMRRKKLVNNLIGWHDMKRDDVVSAMTAAGVDPDIRAEQLPLSAFDGIAAAVGMSAHANNPAN